MITSRRARVAAFVAAGVIGFGGVAAAGPGGPFALTDSDDTTTTTEVTTTTSEVPATTSEVTTTTSEVTTTTSEVVQEDDAPVTQSVIEEIPDDAPLAEEPDPCFGLPDEFDNHGDFVSQVARGEVTLPEGVEQRDAAQSSCGKDGVDAADDADDEAEVEDEVDVEVEADDDSDEGRPEKPTRSERPGKPESPGSQGNGSKKHSDD